MTPAAILVLGARVLVSGSPAAALERRIAAGAEAAREWPTALVIACGGRAWSGIVEADVIARGLVSRGVAPERVLRDRLSMTTIENVREGIRLAHAAPGQRNARGKLALVTCDWHVLRAVTVARALGVDAIGRPAPSSLTGVARARRVLRERVLRALVPLLLVLLVSAPLACRRGAAPKGSDGGFVETPLGTLASSAPSTASSQTTELAAARVAADRRLTEAVPLALSSSADVTARRAAARAIAQIGDAAAIERLGRALSDEDHEVVAWAAYGLGMPCESDPALPRDDRAKLVRAVVARALSLEGASLQKGAAIDPWSGIAWTLGRCGGIDASRELARWLRSEPTRARAASWALGAIAARDRGLEDDVAQALVGAARGSAANPALDDALFPFGRGDWSSRPPVPGLAEVARLRLGAPPGARLFAIRALGRAEGAKPDALRTLLSETTSEAERVEALRALHRMGAPGDHEIAAFATRLAPTDETKTAALTGASFGALRIALELLGEREADKTVTSSLRAFVPKGNAPILASTPAPLARRIATLRCLAGAALHQGKPGEAEVVRCAHHEPALAAALRAELDTLRDLARLATLDRSSITGDARELVIKLARDGSVRVRERALAMIGKHTELEEAPEVIVRALSSKTLGIVAAAAQALAERPSIARPTSVAIKPSKKDIEQALDPKSPPPEKIAPDKPVNDSGFDPKVLEALDGAAARPMEEADAEVKSALAAAIGALRHAKQRGFVLRLCGDRTSTLRRAGRDALARLDPPGKAPACTTVDPSQEGAPSPYAALPPAAKTIVLTTDAGQLTLKLDPSSAPIAVARLAELLGSGFYDGTPIHRVVPGFVVQLGDPGGDGYGGAHVALRCETAPIPFVEGDIGVALAGRDTGSSQFFVMLGRAPHLDGSYAWLGKASGEWGAVVEGDRVVSARVE